MAISSRMPRAFVRFGISAPVVRRNDVRADLDRAVAVLAKLRVTVLRPAVEFDLARP